MTFALLQVVEHETPALLDPKVGLFVFTLLVFLIVAWLLRKFAWGPITEALATREKTIEDSINRAEKALAEARQISEDNEKARREAEVEAQRVTREAREAAEALKAVEVEKTREQIRQMQSAKRKVLSTSSVPKSPSSQSAPLKNFSLRTLMPKRTGSWSRISLTTCRPTKRTRQRG